MRIEWCIHVCVCVCVCVYVCVCVGGFLVGSSRQIFNSAAKKLSNDANADIEIDEKTLTYLSMEEVCVCVCVCVGRCVSVCVCVIVCVCCSWATASLLVDVGGEEYVVGLCDLERCATGRFSLNSLEFG